jgi:AcrR family transcriptional regulator
MSVVAKRPYRQVVRAEAADETRRRILDALYERLREAPTRPISVDEVARRAHVSRSTVYAIFGSRSGLFEALTDRLLVGAGYDRLMEAVSHPDARETLRGGLEGGAQMFSAHRDVLRVLRAMAALDPEGPGRTLARGEANRAAGMARLGKRLAEQGYLRPGVSAERAAHVVWLLASFEAYDLLATDRGLSTEEAVAILVETAESALLG